METTESNLDGSIESAAEALLAQPEAEENESEEDQVAPELETEDSEEEEHDVEQED